VQVLCVKAKKYKIFDEEIVLDFVPQNPKHEIDKQYELLEITDNLFVHNTIGIVGKNATGKTMLCDFLYLVYDILSTARVNHSYQLIKNEEDVSFEVLFYHENFLYFYETSLKNNREKEIVEFVDEKISSKKYSKSMSRKQFFDKTNFQTVEINKEMPEGISTLYEVVKPSANLALYYSIEIERIYDLWYPRLEDHYPQYIEKILAIFDPCVKTIKKIEKKYEITYHHGQTKQVEKLESILSHGTVKGLNLFITAMMVLKTGQKTLIVDEIENHWHKALVESLISMFKDKDVNKKNSTLIFTTHYGELLDLFKRSDNIYITSKKEKYYLENMAQKYPSRNELLKSNKFYHNVYGTNLEYKALIALKRELLK